MMVLHHFPQTADHAFKPEYDRIKWLNDEKQFEAWCEGKTGFPLVDAGMRELNATGYMHNRLRMITGSNVAARTGDAPVLGPENRLLHRQFVYAQQVLLARLVGSELPELGRIGLLYQADDKFDLRVERHVFPL